MQVPALRWTQQRNARVHTFIVALAYILGAEGLLWTLHIAQYHFFCLLNEQYYHMTSCLLLRVGRTCTQIQTYAPMVALQPHLTNAWESGASYDSDVKC